ncbi:outer membrane beta-barrel protein [Fulvivirga sp.]|uniref:outer membrane beta-barrel protein n=1 Tax=Fulvivirga sp. TaxID=1931237 RepID=UPI0032EAD99B
MINKGVFIISRSFLIVFFSILYGINESYSQLLVGARVGGGVSWVKHETDLNKDEFTSKPVLAYNVGLATAIKVRNRFFLQTDILYARKGKYIEGVDDPNLENKASYHYLSVPIIYRVDFKGAISDLDFKWYVGAGPIINYWMSGKGTLKSSELDENDIDVLDYGLEFNYDPDLPEDMLYIVEPNRFQFGLLFSAGTVFEPLPNNYIVVEARLELGHSYLADGQGEFPDVLGYVDDLRVRSKSLQLSVSYLFDTQISKRKKGKSNYKK